MTQTPPETDLRLPAPASDDALVRACLEGANGAWESLVRAYAPLVYSIARRHGLTQHEAEDVSQSVFTSLLQSLPSLRDGQSLAKWLIVVAKRQTWKVSRARPTLAEHSTAEAVQDTQRDEPDVLWQRRHAARQALATLGGRCQELLTALFMQRSKPDYAEISTSLGIPVGSIGPTRNRCLRKLMDILASLPGTGGLWEPSEAARLNDSPSVNPPSITDRPPRIPGGGGRAGTALRA